MKLYTFYGNDGEYQKKEELIKLLEKEEYSYEYTYGLGYRNPTTYHKPISKKEAFKIIRENSLVDVDLLPTRVIHVNTFSTNDMW